MDVQERSSLPSFQNGWSSFPNGWFKACYSDELVPGGVLALRIAGDDLVAFRGENGRAYVLDAHCPHLGAHLGVGGTVVGNTIRCPFHGWRWSGADGSCVEVPYAKCIPSQAEIRRWRVVEQNGFITTWFHAENSPADWTPERIPEVDHADYSLLARRRWQLRTPLHDREKKGTDIASLEALHGIDAERVVRTDAGVIRQLHPALARDAASPSRALDVATIRSFLFGPGLSLARISGLIEAVSVQSLTPLAPNEMELTHDYFLHRNSDRTLAEAFFDDYAKARRLDAPPHNTTASRQRPTPGAADGDMARFRRRRRRSRSRPVDVSV